MMPENSTNRRGFLSAITKLLLAMIGLLLAIPAIWYLLGPLRKKGSRSEFTDVGPVADIPKGEWRLLSLEVVQQDGWRKTKTRHSIWVRREGETTADITVKTSICPHLGCPVHWNMEKKEFLCPCHGGVFDTSGKKVSGPPPRELDALEFEIRSGRLMVRWQDFKIGTDSRIEVNV